MSPPPRLPFGLGIAPILVAVFLLSSPIFAQGPTPPAGPTPSRTYGPERTATNDRTTPSQAASRPGTSPPRARTAAPPFQLTAQQQALLDQVLGVWEKESDKVRSYKCPFERLEYDPAWTPNAQTPLTKATGHIKFVKPDKGSYRITEVRRYDSQTGDWKAQEDNPGEHWVCDGEAVYEFDSTKKQLIVRELPPEMRGKAIADGPLPFLFGAEAAKLKARYFLRVSQTTPTEIWLEAFPRGAHDAANFRRVEVILDRSEFLPKAMQVYLPGDAKSKSRTVYMFGEAKVNDPLSRFGGVFQKPRTPFGWKRIVERPTSAAGGTADRREAGAAAPRR